MSDQTVAENEKRHKKNCEEALGEASDFLWTANGKFIWMAHKTIYCPQYVTKSDTEDMKVIYEKLEQKFYTLNDCKRKLISQTNPNHFLVMTERLNKMMLRIDGLKKYCEKLIRQMNNVTL